MRAALMTLETAGFETERQMIETAWQDFIKVMGYRPTAEYRQAYPDTLLSEIAGVTKQSIEGIGIAMAKPDSQTKIVGILNAAWREFWREPEGYQAWEAAQFDALHTSVGIS